MNGVHSARFDLSGLDSAQSTTEFVSSLLLPKDDASLSTLESAFSALTSQLEGASSDLSSHVSNLIASVAHSVPRLAFDLQLMRERATLLRFTLESVRKKSTSRDESTDEVMRRLAALHTVQRRLADTLDVLREAESWSTLDSEITSLLSAGSFAKAGNRLAEAARSLSIFSNTPEFETRKALLVSLQNSLEANLVGRLVRSVGEHDVKEVKAVGDILRGIGRDEEFRGYYFGARRGETVQRWKAAPLRDCARPEDADSTRALAAEQVDFASWLPRWNAELLSLVSEEAVYIPSIFPSPFDTLGQFLSTTLDSLSPSLPQRISDVASFHGAKALPQLIKLYHATEEFALAVDRILVNFRKQLEAEEALHPVAQASSSSSPPGNADAPAAAFTSSPSSSRASRRTSKRLSVSRRLSTRRSSIVGGNPLVNLFSADSAALQAWETSLFEPFLDWQAEYYELESRYLDTYSQSVRLKASDGSGVSRELWDACLAHFAMAEEALRRCVALTHGYGAVGFVEAVDGVFSRFLSDARDTLISSSHRKIMDANGRLLSEEEVDLEGLDYTASDWATFELGLKMLQTCRSLSERIPVFEHKVRGRLVPIAYSIREASKDPGFVTPGTTRGALTLLRQSTLNSVELLSFLDSLSGSDQSAQTYPHHPSGAIIFPRVRGVAKDLATTCQLMLHDAILGPLLSTLEEYASLPVWASSESTRTESRGAAAFDLTMPTSSLSPTETISRIGEGLFNLPRLFEVYADDDALGFSLSTLPFVDEQVVKAEQLQQQQQQAPSGDKSASSTRSHRRLSLMGDISSLGTPDYSREGNGGEGGASSSATTGALSSEVVVSTWLSSLALTVLSHLTSTVLPAIQTLSVTGASQLACDLEHVSNVAKAFDIESGELERWREAVETSDEEGRKRHSMSSSSSSGERDEIWSRVAKIRGWR
jgi:hypothetical protein